LPISTYLASIWRPRWGDPVGISLRSSASENKESLHYCTASLVWSYVLTFWYNTGMW